MGVFSQRRRRSHTRTLAALATVLFALVIAGCSDDDSPGGPGPQGPVGPVGPAGDGTGIPGSGTVTNQPREVADFDRILFNSEGTVIITEADTGSLVIEADDNLQELLEASVSGRVLEISTADGTDIAPTQSPVFRIEMASIAAVELAGAGTIDTASIEGDRLDITLSGVGDVTIGSLVVDELVLDLQGVGTVSLTGVANRQAVEVGGVAIYDAANLESHTVTIKASGTGQATIWVTDDLDVTGADAASISYYGTPSLSQDVSGLATLVALGAR